MINLKFSTGLKSFFRKQSSLKTTSIVPKWFVWFKGGNRSFDFPIVKQNLREGFLWFGHEWVVVSTSQYHYDMHLERDYSLRRHMSSQLGVGYGSNAIDGGSTGQVFISTRTTRWRAATSARRTRFPRRPCPEFWSASSRSTPTGGSRDSSWGSTSCSATSRRSSRARPGSTWLASEIWWEHSG